MMLNKCIIWWFWVDVTTKAPKFIYFFADSADDSDESVRSQTTETAHPPQDLDLGSVQEV